MPHIFAFLAVLVCHTACFVDNMDFHMQLRLGRQIKFADKPACIISQAKCFSDLGYEPLI